MTATGEMIKLFVSSLIYIAFDQTVAFWTFTGQTAKRTKDTGFIHLSFVKSRSQDIPLGIFTIIRSAPPLFKHDFIYKTASFINKGKRPTEGFFCFFFEDYVFPHYHLRKPFFRLASTASVKLRSVNSHKPDSFSRFKLESISVHDFGNLIVVFSFFNKEEINGKRNSGYQGYNDEG